jgi:hypothetical protein
MPKASKASKRAAEIESALAWLRSQAGVPSGVLCKKAEDLQDGSALLELARLVLRPGKKQALWPTASLRREERLAAVVRMVLQDARGLQGEVLCPRALQAVLASGKSPSEFNDKELTWILFYLRFISGQGAPPKGAELLRAPVNKGRAPTLTFSTQPTRTVLRSWSPPSRMAAAKQIGDAADQDAMHSNRAAPLSAGDRFARGEDMFADVRSKPRPQSCPPPQDRHDVNWREIEVWMRGNEVEIQMCDDVKQGIVRTLSDGAGLCRLISSLERVCARARARACVCVFVCQLVLVFWSGFASIYVCMHCMVCIEIDTCIHRHTHT